MWFGLWFFSSTKDAEEAKFSSKDKCTSPKTAKICHCGTIVCKCYRSTSPCLEAPTPPCPEASIKCNRRQRVSFMFLGRHEWMSSSCRCLLAWETSNMLGNNETSIGLVCMLHHPHCERPNKSVGSNKRVPEASGSGTAEGSGMTCGSCDWI